MTRLAMLCTLVFVSLLSIPSVASAYSVYAGGLTVVIAAAHWDGKVVKCLDTGSYTPGSQIVSSDCVQNNLSQKWNIGADNTIRLREPKVDTCLQDMGDRKALQHRKCTGEKNQQWYTANMPGLATNDDAARPDQKGGQIQNIATNRCADIEGESFDNGAKIVSIRCESGSDADFGSLGAKHRPWNQVFGVGPCCAPARVAVFLRRYPPGLGLDMGHVGWGLERPADDQWMAGAIDGFSSAIINKNRYNGHWKHRFLAKKDMETWFAGGTIPYAVDETHWNLRFSGSKFLGYGNDLVTTEERTSIVTGGPYDVVKYVKVPAGNLAAAMSLESQTWDWGYGLFSNNCLDHTYRIIRAFGYKDPPWTQSVAPRLWHYQIPPKNKAGFLLPGRPPPLLGEIVPR